MHLLTWVHTLLQVHFLCQSVILMCGNICSKTSMSTDMHHMPATATDVPHQFATDSPASVTCPTITTATNAPPSYNINGSSDYQVHVTCYD
jgi:hypothetical protein